MPKEWPETINGFTTSGRLQNHNGARSGLSHFTALFQTLIFLLLTGSIAHAAQKQYAVEFDAPPAIVQLLQRHLEIAQSLDNPRLNDAEWQRLIRATPREIRALVATEGYFSASVESSTDNQTDRSSVKFSVNPGEQATISEIELNFSGEILQQPTGDQPGIDQLKAEWGLIENKPFTQEAWGQEKRKLLSELVVYRYPNARIAQSRAEVDSKTNSVRLMVHVDSGNQRRFGDLVVSGLQRYPESIVRNLNRIKPGDDYSQSSLLKLQSDLQSTGYFSGVEVIANVDADNTTPIPVEVRISENKSSKVGIGVGASTNTGARTQLTYDNLNLLDKGWRLNTSLRLEQRAQSLNANVALPTTEEGYRDSFSNHTAREDIENQILTTSNFGIQRSWGTYRFEQSIGANYLIEHLKVKDVESTRKDAATLSYGMTLRRTDNELMPSRGYLFNVNFTGAPVDSLSDGTFLRSYAKTQLYYPLTRSTQLMTRLEVGAVTGANSAPATYLFRAGGDQSVRGYAYQSLGVAEGDAIVGGRYLLTGSVEVVQWLSSQWGIALFTDFGDAANETSEIKPVYGYGLGARWKSPVGPIGADIAYGEDTGQYRLHFNLGVNF